MERATVTKKEIYKHREAIKKLEITLNPINIIAKSDKRLSIWDINGQLITTGSCQSPIVAATVSNLQLTANSKFNIIYLYNAQNQLQETFKGHNKAIIGVSFSPNNEF